MNENMNFSGSSGGEDPYVDAWDLLGENTPNSNSTAAESEAQTKDESTDTDPARRLTGKDLEELMEQYAQIEKGKIAAEKNDLTRVSDDEASEKDYSVEMNGNETSTTKNKKIRMANAKAKLATFSYGDEKLAEATEIAAKQNETNSRVLQEMENLSEKEKEMVEQLRNMERKGILLASTQLVHTQKEKQNSQLQLEIAITNLESEGKDPRTDQTQQLRQEIKEADKRLKKIKETRDGFYVVNAVELRGIAKNIRNHEIIQTKTVQNKMEAVEQNIKYGKATFLHGPLGSGKTELAINAATDAAIKEEALLRACEAIGEISGKYDKLEDSPLAQDRYVLKSQEIEGILKEKGKDSVEYENAKKKQAKLKREIIEGQYNRNYRQLRAEMNEGKGEERLRPIIISGSNDTTTESLFQEKSLQVVRFNSKTIEEQMESYNNACEKWMETRKGDYEGLPEEERNKRKAQDADRFFKAYQEQYKAFGTEVINIKKGILRGIEEGRPVIIDEINTIPAGILLSLNDILQRKPGESCYVPGMKESVEIQPGFAIIATGNLNTRNIDYTGTKELNPAFQSRFDIMEYDYLPQSTKGEFEGHDAEKDELFKVIMGYVIDDRGNLSIPAPEDNIKKLYKLAQLAGLSQQIFSGKVHDEIEDESGARGDLVRFEKSVLSVRDILRVLDKWKMNNTDLDSALWDGFISNITDEFEKNSMLQLAYRYGFFEELDRWKTQNEAGLRINASQFESINADRLRQEEQGKLEFRATPKVVEWIYGKRPERDYAEIDAELLDEATSVELSVVRYGEIKQKEIPALKEAVQALEVLAEQCGCNNSADTEG